MDNLIFGTPPKKATPIFLATPDNFQEILLQFGPDAQNLKKVHKFDGMEGQMLLIPDPLFESGLSGVLLGCTPSTSFWPMGSLASILPEGNYYIHDEQTFRTHLKNLLLAFSLGNYEFSLKQTPPFVKKIQLFSKEEYALKEAKKLCNATCLTRDLVNKPASHLTPDSFSKEVHELANYYEAEVREITGEELLKQNYPAIHTVGRASFFNPRLLDLRWNQSGKKKITLVGKGVCFDTGGLNLKTGRYMDLMKKDMGGAAHALALASLIMASNLPISLRLLLPIVENSVSGNAYRPGDVINTRMGKTVEIGDTDAEGRLILADALTVATEEDIDLLIDFATLTGAARVALGTEVGVLFSNRKALSTSLQEISTLEEDPLWPLPLHEPYQYLIDSNIADLNNSGGGYAGAITAALFLNNFLKKDVPWIHFDLMSYNLRSRPGRPKGGEAMGLRTVYEYIKRLDI